MIAVGPVLTSKKDGLELSARVRYERFPYTSERIWWRFPREYADFLETNGDPLVPALLLPAMARGERLVIEAPVSERLLSALPRIQTTFIGWGLSVRAIEVSGPPRPDRPVRGSGVGCFFSCGVDSFYSLLKNEELPVGHGQRISHLIFINGFDIKFKRRALYERTRAHVIGTAEALSRKTIEVSANLKSFGTKTIAWNFYWGSFLASVGLALGALFETVIIPASYAWHQQRPDGSHPELDVLWSTGSTGFLHDGGEATRSEKIIKYIVRSELALEHLHVCWRNRNVEYNCGVCEKCLRTMIALYAGTGRTEWPIFSAPLSPESVMALDNLSPGARIFGEENLALLAGREGFGRELSEALRAILARDGKE